MAQTNWNWIQVWAPEVSNLLVFWTTRRIYSTHTYFFSLSTCYIKVTWLRLLDFWSDLVATVSNNARFFLCSLCLIQALLESSNKGLGSSLAIILFCLVPFINTRTQKSVDLSLCLWFVINSILFRWHDFCLIIVCLL